MLTKNTKRILKAAGRASHTPLTNKYLSQLCDLSELVVDRAVKHLIAEGYLDYLDLTALPGKHISYSDPPYILTELGTCWRRVQLRKLSLYVADKWTDIVACIISIIALIISLHNRIPGL